jgi:hypothetical protein
MSGQSVAHSDLLEIAKRNGDFKKIWSAAGAFFYLRSINAARPRSSWWQIFTAIIAGMLGFWPR